MRGLLWLLKKYYYVLVFIFLEAIALVLLGKHNAYQQSYIVHANREISGRIYKRAEAAREYLHLRKTNELLAEENTRLRNELDRLSPVTADSSFLSIVPREYDHIQARVVNASWFKQFNYLTIDKGSKQGISRDMAVIGDEGIVGIVLESSANFSTVIPVINRDFRLSVKVKKNNFNGILQWEGRDHREAALNEIPFHAEISLGDTIVTSGYSAIFPQGIFVGTIKEFEIKEGNFYRIKVALGTNYQQLFHVNVIKNFSQEEQHELESKLDT